MLSVDKSLRKMVCELRELCPPIVPVRVRRLRLARGELGYANLVRDDDGKPSHFNIGLCRNATWDTLWQVLHHEWAHCLAWHEGHNTTCDHDPEWGLAVSRVYQETVAL